MQVALTTEVYSVLHSNTLKVSEFSSVYLIAGYSILLSFIVTLQYDFQPFEHGI
jgi:hypothetical protein